MVRHRDLDGCGKVGVAGNLLGVWWLGVWLVGREAS